MFSDLAADTAVRGALAVRITPILQYDCHPSPSAALPGATQGRWAECPDVPLFVTLACSCLLKPVCTSGC